MAVASPTDVLRPRKSGLPRPVSGSLSFIRRKPLSGAAAIVLAIVVLMVVAAPLITSHEPNIGSLSSRLQSPSWNHIMGTDEQGRDVFTRVLYGGRTSIAAGLGATAVGTAVGVLLGMLSGYAGGVADMVIQRIVDALMAIPALILLMVLSIMLGTNLQNVILAIAIFVVPTAARVVRGAVLAEKEGMYVEAARSIGGSPARIVFRHILPNIVAPVIVIASITVGAAILIESALGFLGLSVPPPNATWGNMLNSGAQGSMEDSPWLALAPGIAIAITVFSINILGDGLRDVLDPRLRGRGN